MAPSAAGRLFLIDSFGLIFRAFYGRARSGVPPMRTSTGIPTEAVYIFSNMLKRLIDEHQPDYLAAVWEGRGPTFRDELFADYKATRAETPPELIEQMPYIQRWLNAARVLTLAHDGYEADDVIATLAQQAARLGREVYIVSSDKDLTQLVSDRIFILNPMKNDLIYDSAVVEEMMGVPPQRVVDMMALKGDSVDNIPGAPGIGDKGARKLIHDYGSVEGAIEHAAEVKRKTYRESLQQNRDQILLSKRLVALATDVPVKWDIESLRAAQPDVEAMAELYRELEFHSLRQQLEAPAGESEMRYRTFASEDEFNSWLEDAAGGGSEKHPISVAVDLSADDELTGGGLGFCGESEEACVLPADLLSVAKKFLEDSSQPKRVHDSKEAIKQLEEKEISLAGVADDTKLATFLVHPTLADYSLPKLAPRFLDAKLDAGLAQAAYFTRQLGEIFSSELGKQELKDLYETIELPLAPVLERMERNGVLLDSEALASLSARMDGEIELLNADIHKLAGSVFNINSPKQLAKVLFEDLNLPAPPRRGKTKALSTASDVLEGLSSSHEIADKILHYRQLAKLKGTYVDALPALVDSSTGRLHTTFNQTGAATGRLSSSNPNLQNIPIRTELGREIRAAFIAHEGWNLLAVDYSQIELRILAHLSGDRVLTDAFQKGEDIHTRTAAEVFGVLPLSVGPEARRRAKAVNFGIVYGLSAFGLSQQLGIPVSDSKKYIDDYFERYSGVKAFIDGTLKQVRRSGITRTLFGRLRPIPEMDSRNPAQRGFAERTAVNSPIQGSAADLIKLAMIRVDQRLRDEAREALMLLQVHDELLFEVPEAETDAVARLVKKEMEGVYDLKVPIVADVKVGKNWRDMERVG